jgi:hypothetical protein
MLIRPVTVLTRRLWSLLFAALWWTCMPAYAAGPDLSATKVCTVNGAQSVLCTITITNIGNVASVAPMSLTDLVTGSSNINLTGAGGSLPVSCTPGAQLINNVPINCGINTSLAAGASGDVLFSFTMPLGGTFTNCASVSQAQNSMTPGDPDSSNNTNICTTIAVSPPAPTTGSITIVKDAQPNDGQDFAFTPSQATMPQFLLDDDSDSTLSNMKTYSGLACWHLLFHRDPGPRLDSGQHQLHTVLGHQHQPEWWHGHDQPGRRGQHRLHLRQHQARHRQHHHRQGRPAQRWSGLRLHAQPGHHAAVPAR